LNNPSTDGLNSNVSTQRKNILNSFKFKKNKVPLPRPSSAGRIDQLDEKQHRKNRQTTNGTLRPARVNILFRKFKKIFFFPRIFNQSFINLLMRSHSSSGRQDSTSTTMNNTNGRRSSIISRSSSMENVKTSTSMKDQYRNEKQPCLWNLDFTPYHSPLIRMK
jgi:hypothetical protein